MSQQILDFVRLRVRQLNTDLNIYKELGPIYMEEVNRITAILGELERIETAIETFMAVSEPGNASTASS